MKLKSKKERRKQLFALQGLSLISARAFSLAEAMIALLIGSL